MKQESQHYGMCDYFRKAHAIQELLSIRVMYNYKRTAKASFMVMHDTETYKRKRVKRR